MSEKREAANKIEDVLSESLVFTSMFDPSRSASMAAYGTILNYEKLQEAFDSNPALDWQAAIEVWGHDAYLSPVIGLTKHSVERLLNGERIHHAKEPSND